MAALQTKDVNNASSDGLNGASIRFHNTVITMKV